MRYVAIGRAAALGLALLLSVSVCALSYGAKEVIAAKVITLQGTVKVTKADGTTETITDTTKPIVLPATIEMAGPKGAFCISVPAAVVGRYNTINWTLRDGEAVRVSLVKSQKGVKFEYIKGTRSFFVDVNNRENVLVVRAIKGKTSLVLLQNKFNIPEKDGAILTHPVNSFASMTVFPGQVSEVEFDYSAEKEYIQFVELVSQAGLVWVTETGWTPPGGAVEEETGLPPSLRLTIPVPAPETFEQSPYR
jgi:hypothetical protein